MYRLLVSDIDGTLVDSRQRVLPGNLRAIQRLAELGVGFTLATGRTEEAVSQFIELLPVSAPLILYNGAKIVDHRSLTAICDWTLEPGVALACLRAAEGLPITPHLYQEGRCYVGDESDVSRRFSRKDGMRLWPVGDLTSLSDQPVTKLLFIADPPDMGTEVFAVYRARLGAVEERCHVVRSEESYLEVLPAGASKGAALRRLLTMQGLARDEVIAVGDNLNDLEMLEVAGLGVAVANANPELLARADYVSVACDEAAIEDVMRRFLSKAG